MSPEREHDHITLEEIISNAKEIMLRDGKHVPILIMGASKNLVVGQIPDMPVTHGERVELMRFLGQAAAKSERVDQLQQVFMVSEGWMSVASEDGPVQMRPSQDPNKKEVLIVSAIQMKQRKKYLKVFEILRDSNQPVVSLEEFLPDEKKKVESVEIPRLEAFVQGFRFVSKIRFN